MSLKKISRFKFEGLEDSVQILKTSNTSKHARNVTVVATGHSFYSPLKYLFSAAQDLIDITIKSSPVRKIDPSSIPCPKLSKADLRRAILAKKLRRLNIQHGYKGFWGSVYRTMQRRILSEQEVDKILNHVIKYENKDYICEKKEPQKL